MPDELVGRRKRTSLVRVHGDELGWTAVRSIIADIASDKEAAGRVELVLPGTGVCSREPLSEASGCCATPILNETSACCSTTPAKKSTTCCG